jgi:hypothetical protein
MKRLFLDEARFDPARDGRIPWRRDPLSLMLRTLWLVLRMLFSRHPGDLWLWWRSMRHRRTPLSLALPWLTFDAIRALEVPLRRPGCRVYEYGSGHSTLYWAKRGAQVWSVEADREWYGRGLAALKAWPQVVLRHAPDRASYVHSIDQVPGDFDIVLVDGEHRLECLDAAVDRVKPGGLLVVDNTDWHWFADVDRHVPAGWPKQVHAGCAPFIGYPSQTTVWQRPLS